MAARLSVRDYVQLMKLRIGSMIALTAVMGYVAVAESVQAAPLVALVAAMLLGSGASSVFNHFYDRDIDRLMTRTMNRPLATGSNSASIHALVFAAVLLSAGMGIAFVAFNAVVAMHLFLGAFFYAIIYTVWLKRRTWMNIVIGGAAGSFAVLAGGAAVDPSQWLLPFLLAVVLFLWTPSHFWALAILLKDDYAKAGIPMLPVLVGEARTAQAILLNSLLLVGASLLPFALGELGAVYGALTAAAGAWFLWLNWRLVKTPERPQARKVFFASMLYLGLLFVAVIADVHVL